MRSSSSTSPANSSSTSSPEAATTRCDARGVTGRVHSTESFALVDGPGVRFAAFLAGCPMRCAYCHNPDTWHAAGETMTAGALWERARRYRAYWQGGGVTVSGGEPMLQMEFVTAFFSLAKAENVHTALDTSGQPYRETEKWLETLKRLMDVTDLVLLDIKAMDDALHRRLTGQTNQNILRFAQALSHMGKAMWIRHVLVPGVTGSDEELLRLKEFTDSLCTVSRIEVLPYHNLGAKKWAALGMAYSLEHVRPPTPEELTHARNILGAWE